jgi:SAM-dependent methyltransferase
MMTQTEFAAEALALSTEAKVLDGVHGYFTAQAPRLYQSCQLFHLLEKELGDVLEIGPFFGYTPFLLRKNASSYTVLEGDDPIVYPLKPLYSQRNINAQFVDLFETFGPTRSATHALDFPNGSFDSILCWETMEHFSFNPVKFVRELLRVLKPGGRVYITVPNKASFQSIWAHLSGRFETAGIDAYYNSEDYCCNGKKAFYGFHWREYSSAELAHLFAKAGFRLQEHGTFAAFQAQARVSPIRRLVRGANQVVAKVLPRYGTHVYLVAEKRCDDY